MADDELYTDEFGEQIEQPRTLDQDTTADEDDLMRDDTVARDDMETADAKAFRETLDASKTKNPDAVEMMDEQMAEDDETL